MLKQLIATAPKAGLVDQCDNVLPVGSYLLGMLAERNAGDGCQPVGVAQKVGSIVRSQIIQLIEHRQSHGRRNLGQLGIDPDVIDLVLTSETKIPGSSQCISQLVIVGSNGAAFKGVEELGGVKTEHFAVAEIPDHRPLSTAIKSVSRIVDQFELMSPRDLLKGVNVTSIAPKMNRNDGRGFAVDQRSYIVRTDLVRFRINVCEDGSQVLPGDRMGRGYERERRQDNLASQAKRSKNQLQPGCGIADGDTMPSTQLLAKSSFQFPHEDAIIAEPTTLKHLINQLIEPLAIAEIGRANMQDWASSVLRISDWFHGQRLP